MRTLGASWVFGSIAALALLGCSGPNDNNKPTPEYTTDVAPIMAANCVGCHQAGSIAPFTLDTFEDVTAVGGALIKDVTSTRKMPPFLMDNTGKCNEWKADMYLTDEEIDIIGRWVDGGMPEGPDVAPPDPVELPELNEVDLTLQMPEVYTPNIEYTDDYRCFIVDPQLTVDQYVIGFEVVPDAAEIVHHIILYQPVDENAEAEAEALDAAEAGPGYTCFGSPGPDSLHVGGWAPGARASYFPEGTGVRFPAGRKMIMQVHYNLLAGQKPDQSLMKLDLTDTVTQELLVVPIADTGMQLPPGEDYVETSTSFALPGQVPTLPVYGAFPHMHTLGQTLTVERIRGGESECLVDVPRWDFNWQLGYEYTEPLDVKGGDTIKITCGYDTSNRTDTVYWGDGTADEMCLNYLTLGVPPGLIP